MGTRSIEKIFDKPAFLDTCWTDTKRLNFYDHISACEMLRWLAEGSGDLADNLVQMCLYFMLPETQYTPPVSKQARGLGTIP